MHRDETGHQIDTSALSARRQDAVRDHGPLTFPREDANAVDPVAVDPDHHVVLVLRIVHGRLVHLLYRADVILRLLDRAHRVGMIGLRDLREVLTAHLRALLLARQSRQSHHRHQHQHQQRQRSMPRRQLNPQHSHSQVVAKSQQGQDSAPRLCHCAGMTV